MYIYIVRHGQTLFNFIERVQGWADSPLTERGVRQGKAVADFLSSISFDRVYSSDLNRAMDTAKYIIEKQEKPVEIEITKQLREAYYGGFEGGPETGPWGPVLRHYGQDERVIETNFSQAVTDVLKQNTNEEIRNIIAKNDPLGLAENYEQFSGRIQQFLDDVLADDDSKNVLIVCHGGTSQLLTEMLLEDASDLTETHNSSTSVIKIGTDKNTLIDFNNVSYLEEGDIS